MTEANKRYERFARDKEQLMILFSKAKGIFSKLELPSDLATLNTTQAKLSSDTFKVLVLGEFKRGKSTFINALLGEEVLPAFAIPCTAVINEIKWSDKKRAILHFTSPTPERLPSSLPKEVLDHRLSYKGKNLPPLSVPVDMLEDYVVIPDPGKDQAESIAESPYRLVELFWPIDLCRNGVEIIDSPGLNEHGTRTRVTTEYLSKVDAVIFVLSCQALVSQSELQVIDTNIRGCGHEDIFFVCNRFDQVRPNERERIISYGHSKLKDKTGFGTKGIYFVSALDALEGRLQKDLTRFEQSGVKTLEEDLSFFLVNDSGRIKLMQPARDLRRLLDKAVFEYIPTQRKLLETDMAELEKRYEEVRPTLEDAERRRTQIKEKIQTARHRLKDDVRREVSFFIRDMSSSISDWLIKYEPKAKFKFISLEGSKKQAESLIKELTEFVAGRIEQEQSNWQTKTLQPFLRESLEKMGDSVRENMSDFFASIDGVKKQIMDVECKGSKSADPMERVLAAAGGYLIGGIGSGLVGGMLGFKEMLKSLIPNIAIMVSLVLLGVANPFVWIGTLLAAGSIQGLLSVNSLTKDFKTKVAQELTTRLRDSADKTSENAANEIFSKTETIMKSIDIGLQNEIQSVREAVESVLAAKRKGELQARERSHLLETLLSNIKTTQSDLNDLIDSLQTKT